MLVHMRMARGVKERLGRHDAEARARVGSSDCAACHRPGAGGREAIGVGAASALDAADLIAPSLDAVGALLVRGFTPREIFAQALARSTSPTRGREDGAA